MFTVTDRYLFTTAVPVNVPVDGGHERQEFSATFEVMPAEQQDAFDLGTTEGTSGFLRGLIRDMSGLVDADKNPVPYSDKVRDQLLAYQFIRIALTTAYFTAQTKAIEGN